MNYESRIGLLILVFVALTLGLGAWLKGNPLKKTRTINVLFDNVHGLHHGSDVEYAGLPCGEVSDFTVTPTGVLTGVIIDNPDVKIHEDDKFIIIPSSTIASEFQIFIIPGEERSKEISTNSTIIGQTPPGMQDFLFQAQDALKNLNLVILKLDNAITNVEPVFEEFGEFSSNGEFAALRKDILQATSSINQSTATFNRLINSNEAQINRMLEHLTQTSAHINRILSGISEKDLREALAAANQSFANIQRLSSSITPQDIQTIREAVFEIDSLLHKLQSPDPDKDAASLIINNLQRIDRISEGLEKSLKNRSVFRTLINPVPIE